MLQDLTITPATVVIALLIVAWAVWAVRRLFFRGVCDCRDHCGDGGCTRGQGGCSCGAVDDMVKNMEAAAKKH